ncbi:Transcriptional regulator GlxA family, contains an amidase domain and an AraC-type DNA-binding HTH domain [Paraburkholderia aspalathi]|uniref:Transcriptional regulator GlxA family, contains an amidase domain and an AraC-type DNA-binding HTH domain n=2 Tax=Paraburkholderia aspalathi TaxID=1324617 RepID=A0A1I7ELM0_9BURK|nr:Transcriptional regulator GlxA family, contains an amidase domain and an AraC-type DNA-binding HTH domain [Paraburkholderia aspalathi]
MGCSSAVHTASEMSLHVLPDMVSVRRVGIVLFSGFALSQAAAIAEVFHSANALTESDRRHGIRYRVSLLSAAGGRIDSSSSVFVWTEDIEAHRQSEGFHALFITGGAGVNNALQDNGLIAWLRRTHPRSALVFPIEEGKLLLDVAGFGQASSVKRYGERTGGTLWPAADSNPSSASVNSLRHALAVVEEDLGAEVARQIADRVAPSGDNRFTAIVRKNTSAGISEEIKKSAKWLEANGHRPVSINEAAQVAVMSGRNFLRRFKVEMGMTPSDYLLYVRLDMSCRLLLESDLPVDKVARRCGIGCGGRLAKLFRKHLATTPGEYRAGMRL